MATTARGRIGIRRFRGTAGALDRVDPRLRRELAALTVGGVTHDDSAIGTDELGEAGGLSSLVGTLARLGRGLRLDRRTSVVGLMPDRDTRLRQRVY